MKQLLVDLAPPLYCLQWNIGWHNYLVEMADMGFGFSRKEVMHLAFQIAEESGIKHSFKNCTAGRKWFEAFRFRYPNLTLHTSQRTVEHHTSKVLYSAANL